ncbi:response regulator [Catenulispora rubra]|uniref:response regulator n=1 Tax=Catenulispora rubra TaxID=280293 RepID=UPI001891F714|nr:response regulator transcription factor [Catenulispora rubra]
MERAIRVFLVDDHGIVRSGLRGFLETAADVEIAGEAATGREALGALSEGLVADVLLLDLVMPGMHGLELVDRLKQASPTLRVVVLSAHGDTALVHQALSLGVDGYVVKASNPARILDAVRAAHHRELYIDPSIAAQVTGNTAARVSPSLTPRERDVVRLVAQGKSNMDIASSLFISERTARTHVSHVLAKLDLQSRVQLALWAVESGITGRE